MLTPEGILQHDDSGELWPPPAKDEFPDLASAYRTALAVRALRIGRGERPVGFKVGFTNRSIWERYAVFTPIWGSMWNTTVTRCEGEGSISLAGVCQPRIEPEAVFGFRATPPRDPSLDDLFAALDWVAPGFEIVQSHMPGWKFTAPQTVADAALHGRLLVGRTRPVRDVAASAAELDTVLAGAHAVLSRNGERVEEGIGSNVLDGPLRVLLHLLAALRSCPGAPDVLPGDVITTGTWTDAWPVLPGEQWTARYDSALPPLMVRFGVGH